MKRSLLSRLHTTGVCCLLSALLFLVGIPCYQGLVLIPQGYSDALATAEQHFPTILLWVGAHNVQFSIYRALLLCAFALLLTVPFNLFRIIVAQEIIAQQDREEEERLTTAPDTEEAYKDDVKATSSTAEESEASGEMPEYAWRGRGIAVIAAWLSPVGLILYLLGTLASTIYLAIVSHNFTPNSPLPAHFSTIYGTFSFVANTIGIGLLALSALFFGAIIARRGRNLWPGIWVWFGYTALAVAALLSGSAVAVASAPIAGQAPLSTPAIILFALWHLWLGVMLVRLKPEA